MKKGGVSWKKRYFELEDEGMKNVRIKYFLKDGDSKIRGELPVDKTSRISDLPNKKSECCCGIVERLGSDFQGIRGVAVAARSVLGGLVNSKMGDLR